MRQSLFFVFSLLFCLGSHAQYPDFSGTWQGVMTRAGMPSEKGTLFYTEIIVSNNIVSGFTREEMYDSPYYSVKKIKGNASEILTFSQSVEIKSEKSSKIKWCKANFELSYNTETGYLTGNFTSTDCRRVIGDVILYRSDFSEISKSEFDISHLWFMQFLKDQKDGLNAPEIRKIERDNFVFEPIFFDFDKSEIRPEHSEFLTRMIKVIKGHSDLRVSVIGHTDSDGTHSYNDKLSERRAKAIIAYFKSFGVSEDRLEIEFKGERSPIDTNETSEGRQLNRRVDFKFI
ncbi:MAG: OmpA family protein [Crocinitomicaceae bacterium]|nr:OmpA family protein [Crocinitomicaceae bacterium]